MRARFPSENDEACSIQIYCSFVYRSRAFAQGRIWRRRPVSGRRPEPDSELPAIAVAMRARMRIKSAKGEREIAASEFFQGLLTTDIQADEMLLEIAFPVQPARSGACFMEVARRRGDFALAGVAAIVTT